MSEASKPTPGPWVVHPDRSDVHGGLGERIAAVQSSSHKADAQLMAEAGDIYHETGMTPAQLSDSVRILRDALTTMRDRLQEGVKHGLTAEEAYDSFYQEVVEDALQATGGKP